MPPRTLEDLYAEIDTERAARDALLSKQTEAMNAYNTEAEGLDVGTAIARVLAAGLPMAIAGGLGGKRAAGYAGAAGGEALTALQKTDALRELERKKRAQLEAETYSKMASEKGKRIAKMEDTLIQPDLAKQKAEATEASKARVAAAGRSNIVVNNSTKTTPIPLEVIEGTLRASGLPPEKNAAMAQDLFNKGATFNDLPNIESGAKAIAGGRAGESPIYKPIQGYAPTPKQQEEVRATAEAAPRVMLKAQRLKQIFDDPKFNETDFAGPVAQEVAGLISGLQLDMAEATGRGANLTVPEMNKINDIIGVVSAAQGPGSAVKALVRKQLGYDPSTALQNFQDRFKERVETQMLSNNYELRFDNPTVSSLFGKSSLPGNKTQATVTGKTSGKYSNLSDEEIAAKIAERKAKLGLQ